MKTLFKNAQVVTKEGISVKDVLVHDRVIEKIADSIDAKADKEYDLTGKYLMPGAIDAHVHFRVPGYEKKEDWKTGSRAALAGGVTTVFDMPNTKPHTTDLHALETKRDLIRKDTLINFGLFFGANLDNLDELNKIKGVVGLKVYMGATTGQIIQEEDARIEALLEKLYSDHQYVVAVHAENQTMIKKHTETYKDEHDPKVHSLIRNDAVAYAAARTAVHLAKKYNGRLHICHMSTKKELELIAKYPDENITCEATPHHLFLTVADYADQENFVKVNPPLRSSKDQERLWDGIKGKQIDIVATDHAPHLREEKAQDYWDAPSGVPGVETMLPLLLNAVNEDMLELPDVVDLVCTRPAEIYGVKGKGEVREGYDADLVVVDLALERRVEDSALYTKCGWSPFSGRILKGWPVMTFVRGRLGMENGKIVESDGLHGKEVEV
ncbi:dihydroorotase family protein [Patescibacteria group bacterium]